MKYLLFVLAVCLVFVFTYSSVNAQKGDFSDEKYRNFLKEKREGDTKETANIQDYRDDRNTKVRKISESIKYEEMRAREAAEQAKYERGKQWDDLKYAREKKIDELVDKGASAQTEKEAARYYKGARELKTPTKTKQKTYR